MNKIIQFIPKQDGSALHSACCKCNLEVVRQLVINGADVNLPNVSGRLTSSNHVL